MVNTLASCGSTLAFFLCRFKSNADTSGGAICNPNKEGRRIASKFYQSRPGGTIVIFASLTHSRNMTYCPLLVAEHPGYCRAGMVTSIPPTVRCAKVFTYPKKVGQLWSPN